MEESKIYGYYVFGYNYRLLRYSEKGWFVHDGPGSGILGYLDEFFETLIELDLQVTLTAAEQLKEVYERLKKLPKDARLDDEGASDIKREIERIDATLDAELKLRTAFIVTPKRIHVQHLLHSPESLFGTDVFKSLPLICQFDFKEGCRCIAFALPTAAAFHFMRATEGILRELYLRVVKRGRVKILQWYPMVEQLRKRQNSSIPKALLDNLDNIRSNFRNPTAHPDARFELDEVQDLLPLSIDVTNRIVRILGKIK